MKVGYFEAFSVPMIGVPAYDHTYVVVDGVHAFGCHGRSAGGAVIASGVGDVNLGICLSEVNGEAGVKYGRSGVCHQAANRILIPARIDVNQAQGARHSYFMWGIFGRQGHMLCSPNTLQWPELVSCVSVHGGP